MVALRRSLLIPLLWIFATGFKTPQDSISYPPKLLFTPSLEGYVNVFTTRSRQSPDYMAIAAAGRDLVRPAGPLAQHGDRRAVQFGQRFVNSMVMGFGSTFLSVFLGTLAAYAFSRFRVPLKDDLLFFILSTRMMPPIAVAIPIFLMYRALGLSDTWLGLILLYTAVNISLAVWLLKGFIDEIPREYEEAAMIDGYYAPPGLREGGPAAGRDRHRRHRHLLPDLRLERVCLRRAAHLRQRRRPRRPSFRPSSARAASTGRRSAPAPPCSCCRS